MSAVADVYLSHAPEDADLAAQLVAGLRAGGFSTWPESERTPASLERSRVVVVLASEAALASRRVTDEVVHAHESGLPCVPVLVGLSHVEMTARQPEWLVALGAATSVEVPEEGLAAVLPRVLQGVAALARTRRRRPGGLLSGRRRTVVVVAAVVVVLVAGTVGVLATRTGGDGSAATDDPSSGRVIPRNTSAFSPGPLADSRTTPLRTVAGDLRVNRVSLQAQVCDSITQQCREAPGGRTFVVLTLSEWEGRDVVVTDAFSIDMDRSYVSAGDARATFTSESQDPIGGTVRIAYEGLPSDAAGGELRLAWPGSSTLVLHPSGG